MTLCAHAYCSCCGSLASVDADMLSFSGNRSHRSLYGAVRSDPFRHTRREPTSAQGRARRSLFPQNDMMSAGPRGTAQRINPTVENRTGPWQPGEALSTQRTSDRSRHSLSQVFAEGLLDDDEMTDMNGDDRRHDFELQAENVHDQQSLRWSDIKALLSSEFSKFHDHLENLSDRMCDVEYTMVELEKKVTDIENESSLSSGSGSTSTTPAGSQKRKRRSPLSLQV